MVPLLVAILLISLLAGVLFIILGIRGRKINNHPVCRWCRFDLEGVYPESITCPECGAGLKREGTVLMGARKRLFTLAYLGVFLCLVSVVPVGVVAYAALTGSDLNRQKPLALLIWESKYAAQEQSVKIANELMNRAMSQSLDSAQYEKVIEASLSRQADLSRPWAEEWGDIIERAKLDNVLKPAQEQRFFNQAGVFLIKTRPNTFAGATLPAVIELKEARVGSSSIISVPVSLDSATLGGIALSRHKEESRDLHPFFSNIRTRFGSPEIDDERYIDTFVLTGSRTRGISSQPQCVSFEIPAEARAGTQSLVLALELRPEESQGFGAIRIMGGLPAPRSTSRPAIKTQLIANIDVLPDSTSFLSAVAPTPAATAELEAHLKPQNVSLQRSIALGEAAESLSLSLPAIDAPHPISYRVFARDGDNEIELGQIASEADPAQRQNDVFSSFSSSFSITINGVVTSSGSSSNKDSRLSAPAPQWLRKSVDIVLKPDPAAAARTLGQLSYYNQELTFKNVPVVPSIDTQLEDPFGSIFQRQGAPKRQPKRNGAF